MTVPNFADTTVAAGEDTVDVDPLPQERVTELGHAHRLVAVAAGRLRYVPTWRRWLVWDGCRWAEDQTGQAERTAKAVARSVTRRAADELATGRCHDEAEAKAALRAALRLESNAAVRGTLALAGTELGIAVAPDQLDAHPELLNVANGVLNLNTNELLDHDPQLLLTKLAPAAYHPDATTPVFEAFLVRIQPDQQMRDFLARQLGYGLLGRVTEHVMPIWYGTGANGKSTLITAVDGALGDYAGTTDPGLLIDRGYDAHPTGVADLFGRRLAFTHETDDQRRLAEGTVKRLTGGDVIKARRMREDFWQFTPSHLLIMVTNHLPVVRGTDNGIWRRLPVVPFDERIPTAEQDPDLGDKLAAERNGILSWLVAGHAQWRRRGLAAPERVTQASAEYRKDQDALARFLDDCCLLNAMVSVRSTQLYAAWQGWATKEGIEPGTQTAFSLAMANRGLPSHKSDGRAVFRGVALLAREEEP
jgi:putative DNA primase/helicase